MAIVNRDLEAGQQTASFDATLSGVVTGQTYSLAVIPYPCQLMSASSAVNGLSGAPNHSLWIQRFVVGSGVTSINIGNSMVVTTFGTSGCQGYSLPSSATYLLQANDTIILSTAAANTAANSVNVVLCVKALQDIKTHFGV